MTESQVKLGADPRPSQCRFRLQDEGKPYPRSSCRACGASVMKGLGNKCHKAPTTRDSLLDEMAKALEELEDANDNLCADRSQETYDAMIRGGQSDQLAELDAARKSARALLTRHKNEVGHG